MPTCSTELKKHVLPRFCRPTTARPPPLAPAPAVAASAPAFLPLAAALPPPPFFLGPPPLFWPLAMRKRGGAGRDRETKKKTLNGVRKNNGALSCLHQTNLPCFLSLVSFDTKPSLPTNRSDTHTHTHTPNARPSFYPIKPLWSPRLRRPAARWPGWPLSAPSPCAAAGRPRSRRAWGRRRGSS